MVVAFLFQCLSLSLSLSHTLFQCSFHFGIGIRIVAQIQAHKHLYQAERKKWTGKKRAKTFIAYLVHKNNKTMVMIMLIVHKQSHNGAIIDNLTSGTHINKLKTIMTEQIKSTKCLSSSICHKYYCLRYTTPILHKRINQFATNAKWIAEENKHKHKKCHSNVFGVHLEL